MVSMLGSQPRSSGFESQAGEDKMGLLPKRCNPCSPGSKKMYWSKPRVCDLAIPAGAKGVKSYPPVSMYVW